MDKNIVFRKNGMKHVVGIAEMKISLNPEDEIVTYSLGSCLGITVYDPVVKAGGLLHVMLPFTAKRNNGEKARKNPYMFVETGVPQFLNKCFKAGMKKSRIEVKVSGGANIQQSDKLEEMFQIGKRNLLVLRKLLWKNHILIDNTDVGGNKPRTMGIYIGTGDVYVKVKGEKNLL
jgi:chemotaxis protein CheD